MDVDTWTKQYIMQVGSCMESLCSNTNYKAKVEVVAEQEYGLLDMFIMINNKCLHKRKTKQCERLDPNTIKQFN